MTSSSIIENNSVQKLITNDSSSLARSKSEVCMSNNLKGLKQNTYIKSQGNNSTTITTSNQEIQNRKELKKTYKLIKPITRTILSRVDLGYSFLNNQYFVFKTIFDKKVGMREFDILKFNKNRKYLMELRDNFVNKEGLIVLVFDKLERFNFKLDSLWLVRKYFKQLIIALKELHSNQVIHLDITATNIMLDKNKDLVLIDFGLSTFINQVDNKTKYGGTPGFVSPEILLENLPSFNSDIYGAGIILGMMLEPYIKGCNLHYFGGSQTTYKDIEKAAEMVHEYIKTQELYNTKIPKPIILFAKLLVQMISLDPAKRPSAESILQNTILVGEPPSCLFDNIRLETIEAMNKNYLNGSRQKHSNTPFNSNGDCYYACW